MKKLAGIIGIGVLMLSSASLANVSYTSLGSDPSKVEPRADGVLVSIESREIVVGIDQYEAEAACRKNNMSLPNIFNLAEVFGANPHKEDSAEKCSAAEHSHLIGQNEYLCYTANPQSGELGNYWFWSSTARPSSDADVLGFVGYGTIDYDRRGHSSDVGVARCVR